MEDSSAANGGGGRKVWGFLLAVVLLIALGLAVGILVVKLNSGSGTEQQGEEEKIIDTVAVAKSTNEALRACDNIKKSFLGGEITFNDSRKEFEGRLGDGDNIYKVYFAMCYADFAYKYTEDVNLAIEVMSKVRALADSEDVVIRSYYAALKDLYIDAGNDEKVAEIEKILDEINETDEYDPEVIIMDDEE